MTTLVHACNQNATRWSPSIFNQTPRTEVRALLLKASRKNRPRWIPFGRNCGLVQTAPTPKRTDASFGYGLLEVPQTCWFSAMRECALDFQTKFIPNPATTSLGPASKSSAGGLEGVGSGPHRGKRGLRRAGAGSQPGAESRERKRLDGLKAWLWTFSLGMTCAERMSCNPGVEHLDPPFWERKAPPWR